MSSCDTKSVVIAQRVEKKAGEFGFAKNAGKQVLVFCSNYIYYGFLAGVNCHEIELNDPYIVYETGAFSDNNFKDAQSVKAPDNRLVIGIGFIECMFETAKTPKV